MDVCVLLARDWSGLHAFALLGSSTWFAMAEVTR